MQNKNLDSGDHPDGALAGGGTELHVLLDSQYQHSYPGYHRSPHS